MCTPQFMQGIQQALARSGVNLNNLGAGATGATGIPGAATQGATTPFAGQTSQVPQTGLPATAGVPTRLPAGTPPLPTGASAGGNTGAAAGAGATVPGGMATGAAPALQTQPTPQATIPNAQAAPAAGFPRSTGTPGFPTQANANSATPTNTRFATPAGNTTPSVQATPIRVPVPTQLGGAVNLAARPTQVGGQALPGVNANTPPGAGVRGVQMPTQSNLQGALPVRQPNVLPRRSLRMR